VVGEESEAEEVWDDSFRTIDASHNDIIKCACMHEASGITNDFFLSFSH
jgi:hypothetical protein